MESEVSEAISVDYPNKTEENQIILGKKGFIVQISTLTVNQE
jgi:hypothetical protein